MASRSEVKQALRRQRIETPSWAYGNSGTRFKVFPSPVWHAIHTRRSTTPPRCTASRASPRRWPSTSPGTGSTTTRTWPSMPGASEWRLAPSTPTSSRSSTTNSAASATRTRLFAGKRHRPSAGVRRGGAGDRFDDLEPVVCRRHQLPGPGRYRQTPGLPGGGSCARSTGRLPDGHEDAARVQVLRARLLHHGRARLGHVAVPTASGSASGPSAGRHRPPRPGHQHRVHRGGRCSAPGSWAASTSTAASTPTTTSWSVPRIPSSCSAS